MKYISSAEELYDSNLVRIYNVRLLTAPTRRYLAKVKCPTTRIAVVPQYNTYSLIASAVTDLLTRKAQVTDDQTDGRGCRL